MIYFIISLTTEYKKGIKKLKYLIDYYKIINYKIIINSRNKDLNFNFEFKLINIEDELKSLLFIIDYYYIKDEEFIVKVNGNYLLKRNSLFMNYIMKLNRNLIDIDVISKYFFIDLFVIRCKYIKKIDNNNERFELRFEKCKKEIEEKKEIYLDILGINVNPKINNIYTIY